MTDRPGARGPGGSLTGGLMKFHVVPYDDIQIPTNRQRRTFDEEKIQELAASIVSNGLIQPVVLRAGEGNSMILVAGERRLRALDIVWGYGEKVYCNNHEIPERGVPCVWLGELDEVDAYEIELEENIQRTDLDWREKAVAVENLYKLRLLQSQKNGTEAPTPETIASEVSDNPEAYADKVRQDIILARNMDNPVVAKATSRSEAFKALKRYEETKRNEALGISIGATFNANMHSLLQGDCLKILPTLSAGSFDVILTDPPYGMGADEFGDSDGKTAGAHRYRDSYETFAALFSGGLAGELTRVAKEKAHLYAFCDIERFTEMKHWFESHGWKVFRTPLIWVNPTAMRAPWPEHGPQRKWQMILYAIRGQKPVTRLYSDVLQYPSDPNLGHQAQKPVALLVDLLRRSIRPGDSILDPFAGTGSLYPACHELKCRATGIECDPAAVGIAAKRLEQLK